MNTAVSSQLSPAGEGFTTYNRANNGADQYGTEKTIQRIVEIGRRWAVFCAVPFAVGDISRKGGGVLPPHKSHQRGVDLDLRPLRTDGQNLPITYLDAGYSRDRTRELVKLIREVEPRAIIYFNDSVLIREKLTQHLTGHHNHLHVRFPD
jgi:penicillin-insensitive murein DD-endopeptidase